MRVRRPGQRLVAAGARRWRRSAVASVVGVADRGDRVGRLMRLEVDQHGLAGEPDGRSGVSRMAVDRDRLGAGGPQRVDHAADVTVGEDIRRGDAAWRRRARRGAGPRGGRRSASVTSRPGPVTATVPPPPVGRESAGSSAAVAAPRRAAGSPGRAVVEPAAVSQLRRVARRRAMRVTSRSRTARRLRRAAVRVHVGDDQRRRTR